jgi:hypothetical protein
LTLYQIESIIQKQQPKEGLLKAASVCFENIIPTSMYFPKREELSFLVVFALPKASMIGLVATLIVANTVRNTKILINAKA